MNGRRWTGQNQKAATKVLPSEKILFFVKKKKIETYNI
jgi:hypothetical protein